MAKNITAVEACERVTQFSQLLAGYNRTLETINAGEALFGLSISEYPGIARISRELDQLNKLYAVLYYYESSYRLLILLGFLCIML